MLYCFYTMLLLDGYVLLLKIYIVLHLQLIRLTWNKVFGFNVEERIPLIKVGPQNSLFGLSVAQHYIKSTPTDISDVVILVGAPTSHSFSGQFSNNSKPGALFRCNLLAGQNTCEEVIINQPKSTLKLDSSSQWLGVTVQSQKPGGKVAVCAHRYTQRGVLDSKGVIWEGLIGQCFLLNNDLSKVDLKYSPCEGLSDPRGSYSHEYYASCQAGMSLAFGHNKYEDVTFGSPGTYTWRGGFFATELNPLDVLENDLLWPEKNDVPLPRNSYLGFSLTIGNLTGQNNLVSGGPRANDKGAVVIFSKNQTAEGVRLDAKEILHGPKFASSFGYDVKVFDVTGDERDDLIVGAPQYYDREAKHGGAVFIYVNKGLTKIGPKPTITLYGKLDSSFGNSIAILGDINMDGINDIAIGAPGADDGVGSTYIYHGNSNGVDRDPTQVLKGTDLISDNITIRGFGYSVSGSGLDMDLNGYPDLTVGSLSNIAVLYRTKPILNVIAKVSSSVSKVDINATTASNPNVVRFYNAKTNKTDKLVAFNVSVCMLYNSVPTTAFNDPVTLKCNLALDEEKILSNSRPRATFVPLNFENGTKAFNLELSPQSLNQFKCDEWRVYLDPDMQDKLSPFVLALTYDVIDKPISQNANGNLISLSGYPILNKKLSNKESGQVNISKNCGEDEICHSNLTMNVEYVVLKKESLPWVPLEEDENGLPLLLVGTEKGIGIKLNVSNPNPGEDAHQAKFKMILPSFFRFSGLIPKTSVVSCNENSENKSLVECSLGNPFRTDNFLGITIKLENKDQLYSSTNFTISMAISTSSIQDRLGFKSYPVSVRKQVELIIDGYSFSEQIPFGGKVIGESAVKSPEQAGLSVVHNYDIINSGSTGTGKVIVSINWPYSIPNGKWLFYLIDIKVTGVVSNNDTAQICQVPAGILDPLNLRREAKDENSLRSKRDTSMADGASSGGKSLDSGSSEVDLKCPVKATCATIECSLNNMPSDSAVFIEIKSVAWNSTFLEEFNGTSLVKVFSSGSVRIAEKNALYTNSSVLSVEVSTTMLSEKVSKPKEPIKLWIIIVSSFAGVIVLVLIVLLLWKCGFFKRRRDFADYHKASKHRQASKKADETSRSLMY